MDSGTHPPIPVRRWWSHLRAAVVAGFVAALVAAPALVLVYQSRPAIRLGMDRALPDAAQGFYPLERQGKTGFAWSGGRATLSFDRLDRRGAWRCRQGRFPASRSTVALLAIGLLSASVGPLAAGVSPVGLRCEYLSNPTPNELDALVARCD